MGSIRLAPAEVVAVGGNYLVEGATVYELNERGTNRMSAHVEGYRDGADDAECARVARLFSAAPDLLAALKAHQAFTRDDKNPFGHDCEWCAECHQRVVDMQIRAVKKAESR